MAQQDLGALRDFARAHHVHYEVEPERLTGPGPGELVGVRLRLLATHEGSRLEVPGCPACVELLGALRSFADRVTAEAGVADRVEAIPATRKLYQVQGERNADEVALTLRVRCNRPEHRRPGAGEDRCLAALRDGLAEAGVPRA